MSKALLVFPLYKQVSAAFFANWLTVDTSHVVGSIAVKGVELATSMRTLVAGALTLDNWDRLIIVEDDVIMPTDAITRMAGYDPQHAVVGALYFMHEWPHHAIVSRGTSPSNYGFISAETVSKMVADPGLYEADAVGCGLTSIARHVLTAWEPRTRMFANDEPYNAHDAWFCHHARAQGHHIYVDSHVVCDHLTEVPIGYHASQDAVRMWEKTYAGP